MNKRSFIFLIFYFYSYTLLKEEKRSDKMNIVLLAMLIGGLGGACSSILGYLEDEEEPFIPKKFASALIRSIIGGVLLSTTLEIEGTLTDYVLLFIAAIGVDVSSNNAWKLIKRVKGETN